MDVFIVLEDVEGDIVLRGTYRTLDLAIAMLNMPLVYFDGTMYHPLTPIVVPITPPTYVCLTLHHGCSYYDSCMYGDGWKIELQYANQVSRRCLILKSVVTLPLLPQ